MSDSELTLKQDWVAAGTSDADKQLAEFLNAVAMQFNMAEITTGGTAKATKNGMRLEVDDAGPYHFEVIQTDTTHVEVRGGWWAFYEAEVRTQVDLDDGSASTITSYEDTTEPLAEVTAAGLVYLKLDLSDPSPANYELSAEWATVLPADSVDIYYKKIAETTWNAGEPVGPPIVPGFIESIKQSWRGGNILNGVDLNDGGVAENDHSFHFASTGVDAGDVTDGFYRIGDGTGVEITPAALTDTTTRWYWVKADYSSNPASPTITWENNATGFPTTVAEIFIYPIFSFTAGGVCTEHRQTDIQLPEFAAVTVVTDVRYDTTSHQIQKKTRTAYLEFAGKESAWTIITGGQAGVCDDS